MQNELNDAANFVENSGSSTTTNGSTGIDSDAGVLNFCWLTMVYDGDVATAKTSLPFDVNVDFDFDVEQVRPFWSRTF